MSKDLSLIKNSSTLSIFGITIGSGLLFFGAQIFAIIIVVIGLQLLGNSGPEVEKALTENIAVQLATLAVVALSSMYLVLKVLGYLKEDPKKFLLLNRFPTRVQVGESVVVYGLYFLTLIAAVVLVNIFNALVSPNNPIINTEQVQDLGIEATTGLSMAAAFIMLVIIPPIYEEILFRGFLFNLLRKRSSQIVAGVLTSIMFGLAHLEYSNLNWIAAIDTLIFSGFLIYISQKHKSLYSAMLVHVIKNSIAFYVLFVR
jgi:membrane protease YdiL (CAAX protease family)